VLCDLAQKIPAVDLYNGRRHSASHENALTAGLLHGDCMTISGQMIAEVLLKTFPDAPRRPGTFIRPRMVS
jgi:dihydroxy-acid dehydratase